MNLFSPTEHRASSWFGNFNGHPLADLSGHLNPASEANKPWTQADLPSQIDFGPNDLSRQDRSSFPKRPAMERQEVEGGQTRIDQLGSDRSDQKSHPILFKKPNLSYIALISQAINSRADRLITLKEIYRFIEDTYPYYRFNQSRWQNSVRHNLSLNQCFERLPQRSQSGTSKVSYWTIRPNVSDELRGSRMERPSKGQLRATRKQDKKPTRISLRTEHRPMEETNNEIVEKLICQECKLSKRLGRLPIVGANSLKFTIRKLIEQ